MARPRRLRRKAESKLDDGIDLFLTAWPEFNAALSVLRDIRKRQYNDAVFDFFALTLEPNSNDLAKLLNINMYTKLKGIVKFNTCERTAEQLMTSYRTCLSEDSESTNWSCLSTESQAKFKENIENILLEWRHLTNILNLIQSLMKYKLKFDMVSFFFKNPDTEVDGLAEMIHNFMKTTIDSLVDLNDCKKAASELWKIHQGCLDGNYELIKILREAAQQ